MQRLFLILIFFLYFSAETIPAQESILKSNIPDSYDSSGRIQSKETSIPGSVPLETPVDPATYILGPGDKLLVGMWGEITNSFITTVTAEGVLILPPAGAVPVYGLTITQAKDEITGVLRDYYTNLRISINLVDLRRFKIFVLGEVINPGSYVVTQVDRVIDAIRFAGGLRDNGSERFVQLKRRNNEKILTKEIDLYSFLAKGEIEENPFLSNGDIIFVPLKKGYVKIVGAVNGTFPLGSVPRETDLEGSTAITPRLRRSILFEFKYGDTVSDVIRAAGGLAVNASLDGALIRRKISNSPEEEIIPLDLKGISSESYTSADVEVKNGDMIEISFDNRVVYVTGSVPQPGPIAYQANLTAGDYVGKAGGPSEFGSENGWKLIDDRGLVSKIEKTGKIEPGDTIMIPEKFSHKFSKVMAPLSGVATIVISVAALINSKGK